MTAAHAPLQIDSLRRACAGARFGHTIHSFETIASTNTLAQRLAADGAAEGTVVIAEAQTQGRGRLGRSWISPAFRNLYLSIVLRPPIPAERAPQIGLVAGLATAETIRDWGADVALKWPNDVLLGGRKVAGMLTELDAEDQHVRYVILGIGVNLNTAPAEFPEELRAKAISLCAVTGGCVDRTAFATRLLSRLQERYELFLRAGFAPLGPLCEALSSLGGRRVRIDGGAQQHEGVVVGISADGRLRVRDDRGHEIQVVAGEVTVVGGYAAGDVGRAVPGAN